MRPTPSLLAFAITFAISAALTPALRAVAHRYHLYAEPTRDRWHRKPVALLGGFAIAGAFLTGLILTGELRPLLPLLLCTGAMFAVGTADDIWDVRPTTKLVAQVIVAAALIYLAPHVSLTGSIVLDWVLALLWIVGITNAFNLLDNIDGLAAGIAVIAGLCYLAIMSFRGSDPMLLAIAAFTGAVLGFLIYNFEPASIFMGDGGSLFLGSFLGTASFLLAPTLAPQVASMALVPLLILLIPIFDTTFVTLTRRLAGRSAIVGGRDHTSHRLVALGITDRQAVLALYALAAIGGLVAISLGHVNLDYAAVIISLYLIVVAALGVVLGHVNAAEEGVASRAADGRAPLVADLTYQYRIYEVLLDMALIAVAYYASFRIRFDQQRFTHFLPPFVNSFPIVVACQLTGLWLVGKYRQVWPGFDSEEVLTIVKGVALGVAGAVSFVVYLYRFESFSRGMFVIDGVLLSALIVGSRVAITRIDEYLRTQRTLGGRAALIYGAGRGGALLVRELLQNRSLGLTPVGFVDDDRSKRRIKLSGIPVLGQVTDLAAIIRDHSVSEVLISIRGLAPEQLALVVDICRQHGVQARLMRLSLERVADLGTIGFPEHEGKG